MLLNSGLHTHTHTIISAAESLGDLPLCLGGQRFAH